MLTPLYGATSVLLSCVFVRLLQLFVINYNELMLARFKLVATQYIPIL